MCAFENCKYKLRSISNADCESILSHILNNLVTAKDLVLLFIIVLYISKMSHKVLPCGS